MLRRSLGLAFLVLLAAQPAFPQSSPELEALRKEVEALKEGQAAIQRELRELRTLLRGRQSSGIAEPQNVFLTVEGAPFMGDQNAILTLIEFSDYQCPFCSRHVRETLPQIVRDYVKPGKVKYVVRDFPIESTHPQAFKGHEAARCAREQGRYWEMHARLFANQRAMGPHDLANHAQSLALDLPGFQQCLDSGRHAAGIRRDLADGQKAGVTGTPSFFLGLTEPNEPRIKALKMLRGAHPYASFREAIEGLLAQASLKR